MKMNTLTTGKIGWVIMHQSAKGHLLLTKITACLTFVAQKMILLQVSASADYADLVEVTGASLVARFTLTGKNSIGVSTTVIDVNHRPNTGIQSRMKEDTYAAREN